MRHSFVLILIMVQVINVIAANVNTPPGTIEAEEAQVVEMATVFLPQKQKQLAIKIYTGSIGDVITERIVDVNDVVVYADAIQTKAKEVCERNGDTVTKQEAVKKLLEKHTKKEQFEKQKSNAEFIGAVIDVLAMSTPDVNDPNYVEIVKTNSDFLLAVLEITTPL